MNTRRHDLVFDAEFSLVYLLGEAPDAGTSLAELTHAESVRMLGSRDGAVAIFTAREWDVPIAVEISESAPPEDFDGWGTLSKLRSAWAQTACVSEATGSPSSRRRSASTFSPALIGSASPTAA